MKILETTAQLIRACQLCDNCLGRQFGNLLSGLSNDQRGSALRYLLMHQSMLGHLKEQLMSDAGFPQDGSTIKNAQTNFCQKMEQDFGTERWGEFINTFLLYVSMLAEIELRRNQSSKALEFLEYLAEQGFNPARETLKKSVVKLALEKIINNRSDRDAGAEESKESLQCSSGCYGILERPELRIFLLSHVETLPTFKVITTKNDKHDSISQCELCKGFFHPQSLERWCDRIEEKCRGIEFYTFVVGSVIPPEIMEKEDEIQANYGLSEWAEILKSEINREVGKRLLQRWESLQRSVDVKSQDLVILVNLIKNQAELNIHPVFIEGRYCKYVRDIPQSHWPCKDCNGRGCQHCDYTGKKYPTSVAELIINPALPLFEGEEGKFHGAGREDIDARMLGEGRPFVLEIIKPKKRTVSLEKLEQIINESSQGKISVKLICYTTRTRLRQLKGLSSKTSKKYLAIVEVHGKSVTEILSMKSEIEDFFRKKEIEQWTPRRVLHRRANKLRRRTVHSLRVLGPDPENKGCIQVEITCDGGLYVKELISGDDGRTQPNFSQITKAPAKVVALDVLEVLINEMDGKNDLE